MTQTEKILDYMRNHDGITSLDALRDLGCARLAARICDLRKDGHNIQSFRRDVRTKDGRIASVAVYRLLEEANNV